MHPRYTDPKLEESWIDIDSRTPSRSGTHGVSTPTFEDQDDENFILGTPFYNSPDDYEEEEDEAIDSDDSQRVIAHTEADVDLGASLSTLITAKVGEAMDADGQETKVTPTAVSSKQLYSRLMNASGARVLRRKGDDDDRLLVGGEPQVGGRSKSKLKSSRSKSMPQAATSSVVSSLDLATTVWAAAGLSLVAGISFGAGYAFGRRSGALRVA